MRLLGSVVCSLAVAGCGLVLDARPTEAGRDASSMDAPSTEPGDAGARPDDAPEMPSDGGANVVEDADMAVVDAAFVLEDAPAPLDAWSVLDAWHLADASSVPDAFAPRDAGNTDAAARDAWSCTTSSECGSPTLGGVLPARTCGGLGCSGGMCGPRVNLDCPVSGCTTGCLWVGSSLRCMRSGSGCADLLHACDTDVMCDSAFSCRALPCTSERVCVPRCSTPGVTCTVTASARVLTGTCGPDGVCLPGPTAATAWCEAIAALAP